MRIVMMGPPGAGKGTQGVRLARTLDVPHIASGDLLRRVLAEEPDSELARAAHVINEGKMVSDDVAAALVFREMPRDRGFVLDGFPRTVTQAERMREHLEREQRRLNAVLYLHVSEEEILARLAGRLTCVNCGETYHVVLEPPRVPGICDRCGSPLEVRPDDQPDRVRTRMHLYREQTAPLVDWYLAAGLLKHVDASGTQEDVFQRCLETIAGLA